MPLPAPAPADDRFAEKEFYLDEFHDRTLFFATPSTRSRPDLVDVLAGTIHELAGEEVRTLLLTGDASVAGALASRGLASSGWMTVDARDEISVESLIRVWQVLRSRRAVSIVVEPEMPADWAALAARWAVALRVYKLVLLDPAVGVASAEGRVPSFLDAGMVESLLMAGEAGAAGAAASRGILEAVRLALSGGVPSINVCAPSELPRELFTYEGVGTLFTADAYCRVERLGVDDLEEVETLLERGQREGFLKPRGVEQLGELLFTGYGARIGEGHLAGVGSLLVEPYRAANVGEIVGLYTITRFQGEGVGGKLLARMTADAEAMGLGSVFACTTQDRARMFFRRHGFDEVSPSDVPRSKWEDYDPDRRTVVSVFRKALGGPA